jgi:hypothetical protein
MLLHAASTICNSCSLAADRAHSQHLPTPTCQALLRQLLGPCDGRGCNLCTGNVDLFPQSAPGPA